MHVEHTPSRRIACVLPQGELDIVSAPELRGALDSLDEASLVVVDLAQVTFLDSTVLGVVVAAARRLAACGRRLIIANAWGISARACLTDLHLAHMMAEASSRPPT